MKQHVVKLTDEQIDALQHACDVAGINSKSEATREALRVFCKQYGVKFPVYNPKWGGYRGGKTDVQ